MHATCNQNNTRASRINPPVSGSVMVTLTISVTRANGAKITEDYRLTFLDGVASEVATKAFRLVKVSDGSVYDIRVGEYGAECDCADWNFRRQNGDGVCKHIAGLRGARYLDNNDMPKLCERFRV